MATWPDFLAPLCGPRRRVDFCQHSLSRYGLLSVGLNQLRLSAVENAQFALNLGFLGGGFGFKLLTLRATFIGKQLFPDTAPKSSE